MDNLKRKDVLRDLPAVLTILRFGQDNEITDDLLEIIEYYMSDYYTNHKLTREPYNPVPGGEYVTSMDAPLLAVCCRLVYERTGDVKYNNYMYDLIPYLLKTTTEGGFLLKEDVNLLWPLEYAWKDITPETAWYTINGSLFGMVGIELIRSVTNDERLITLSKSCYNSYKKHESDFYYPDDNWVWYSLNSPSGLPVINQTEKLFIELRALKALYELTNIILYKQMYDHRLSILNKLYPVYAIKENQKMYLSFLRAGAPHPYYVDIYPNDIELYDVEGQLIDTVRSDDRNAIHSYLKEEISSKCFYYKLYASVNSIKKTLLIEGELKLADWTSLEAVDYKVKTYWGDCIGNEGNVFFIDKDSSDKQKAFLYLSLDDTYENSSESYFIIDLDNRSDEEFPIYLSIIDDKKIRQSRYLQNIKRGNNTLLFNYLGFSRDDGSCKNVSNIQIDFITNIMKQNNAEIKINGIYYADSSYKVVNYLERKKYDDYWYYSSDH